MNEKLIILGTVTFVFIIVILAIMRIMVSLGKLAFNKIDKGGVKSFGLFFVRSNFYRIIALILIVYTFIVVAIFDLDKGDKLITVLSSIAAFTLGGFTSANDTRESNNTKSS